jgi:type IV secretion system protein VirB6
MLFQGTRQFFDSWWKFLISFTLQPVVAFTAITIINFLIMVAYKVALGFSVCPGCFWNFYYPQDTTLSSYIINFCIIPGYELLENAHFPTGSAVVGLSPSVFTGILAFIILSKGMLDLCGFISKVTNIIITGSYINVTDLASYGDTAAGMAAAAGRPVLDRAKSVASKAGSAAY